MRSYRPIKNDICQFAALVVLALVALPLFAHGATVFEHGAWFDGKKFVQGTWYSVDGKLRQVWEGKVDARLDLEGKYIVPPLAEGHTHDFSTGTNLERDVRRYLRSGIFYAKNMNSIIRLSEPVRPRLTGAESVEVTWANAGITATGGHPVQIFNSVSRQIPGWQPSDMEGEAYFIVDSTEELERKWPAIVASRPDFLKAYLETSEEHAKRGGDPAYFGRRGLSPAVLTALVERAHGAGLPVSVHVRSAADFRTAVAAGANEIAHLPLEKLTERDAVAAAKNGVTVVTTTLSHRPTDGIADLDVIHAHNLRLLYEAGVRLSIGTDSGQTALDEILNVARLMPVSRPELLRIAGETAQAIFPGRKLGRLSEGYEASFLVLNASPLEDLQNLRTISMRVKQGHLLSIDAEKPLIGELLAPIIMKENAAAGLRLYEHQRAAATLVHDDSEASFNQLGYLLLNHDRIDDAIAVFAFNTSRFPSSANTWDSLAEAWMKKGNREKAVEFYRKSLELNPHNKNAEEKLRVLGAKG